MNQNTKARAAEVARASYGKLLAVLASQTRDIEAAEDALAEAFARALETWPRDGIPQKPEAWILTTARNKMRDMFKSAAYQTSVSLDADDAIEPAMENLDQFTALGKIPDERLKLLFVCAHPAIDRDIRTPLMLQTVLGLEASHISSVFLVSQQTMAQRLVRAKQKIKNARIPFILPERNQMEGRLDSVLEAIYGAYSADWNNSDSKQDFCLEALFLSDLLVELLPNEAEVLGLAALLNYSVSRRSNTKTFIPLAEQDPADWNAPRAERGDNLLARAKSLNRLGRFQLEAAIQSVHSNRRNSVETDWSAIVQLYEGLLQLAPTIGAAVAQAAAIGEAHGWQSGLNQLNTIEQSAVTEHQPYWATRAHLQVLGAKNKEAKAAFKRAIELTRDEAVKHYLLGRLAELSN